MAEERFSLRQHVPKFSKFFWIAIFSPLPMYIALAGNTLMFLGAAIFYQAEINVNPAVTNYFDAIWWAMSTVSTVGFGDVYPMTTVGRIAGMGLIVSGVFFFVGFTAAIATSVISMSTRDLERTEESILKELREIRRLLEDKNR